MNGIQTLSGNRKDLKPADLFEACRSIVANAGVEECRRLLASLMEKHQIAQEEANTRGIADFLKSTVTKNKTTPQLEGDQVIEINERYASLLQEALTKANVTDPPRIRRSDRIFGLCVDIHIAALKIVGLENLLKEKAAAKSAEPAPAPKAPAKKPSTDKAAPVAKKVSSVEAEAEAALGLGGGDKLDVSKIEHANNTGDDDLQFDFGPAAPAASTSQVKIDVGDKQK